MSACGCKGGEFVEGDVKPGDYVYVDNTVHFASGVAASLHTILGPCGVWELVEVTWSYVGGNQFAELAGWYIYEGLVSPSVELANGGNLGSVLLSRQVPKTADTSGGFNFHLNDTSVTDMAETVGDRAKGPFVWRLVNGTVSFVVIATDATACDYHIRAVWRYLGQAHKAVTKVGAK